MIDYAIPHTGHTASELSEESLLASFTDLPFSVLCHAGKYEKYKKNWRSKERKKEATKKKEGLPR